jgi:H+-transporting ATPase
MDSTTEVTAGLSEAEVLERRRQYGYNEIREQPPSLARGILKRLWGPIPWLLEAALIFEVIVGRTAEPAIIAAWLLFSAVVGGIQELRGQHALDLLRNRLRVTSRVWRSGDWQLLPARDLVPGDHIRVQTGDLVPADCAIKEGTLELDQSALTGESAVVIRTAGETIYSASTVRRGEATATVELVRTARSAGHLDRLLFAVVRQLVTIDAVLAAVLLAFALWRGTGLLDIVPFLLVLVTATVPVTMPAAFAVANAVEARMLAKAGILVTGLNAVQEAATLDVLCVDKTGTLTENRQRVAAVENFSGETKDAVLLWAAAACDASTPSALDLAILQAAEQRGISPLHRQQFTAFDPATKYSEARVRRDGDLLRVVLGSPLVVERLAEPAPEMMDRVQALATTGARVLAVAAGPDNRLTLRGLLALADTPREDAATLVTALGDLGIRVLMVSGDTGATARAVSRTVGLGDRIGDAAASSTDPLDYDGFANLFPEDKFRLVQTLQRIGRIAGMTGDGVNDAPALRQADVGIAVSTATDVAKAAARVVLTRPGLHDMLDVVHSGRRVYRRMLTWTITKIARTVELAALLTIGYIATGFFVTSLLLIAVLVILNDVVTITLATDRAWVSPAPEQWNVKEIGKIAGVLAAGWLALGFAVLWAALHVLTLSVPQIQTLMFAYLIYSAQATIYITRVRGRAWSFAPSRYVVAATVGNAAIATALSAFGILTATVSMPILLATLAAVLAATFVLDEVKLRLLLSSGESKNPR